MYNGVTAHVVDVWWRFLIEWWSQKSVHGRQHLAALKNRARRHYCRRAEDMVGAAARKCGVDSGRLHLHSERKDHICGAGGRGWLSGGSRDQKSNVGRQRTMALSFASLKVDDIAEAADEIESRVMTSSVRRHRKIIAHTKCLIEQQAWKLHRAEDVVLIVEDVIETLK